jgi:hypothetical protein
MIQEQRPSPAIQSLVMWSLFKSLCLFSQFSFPCLEIGFA